MIRSALLAAMLCAGVNGLAQDCEWTRVAEGKARIVSRTLIPGSLKVAGVSDSLYSVTYLPESAEVELTPGTGLDSVLLCYNRLPQDLLQPYSHRSIRSYDSVPYRFVSSPGPGIHARESFLPGPGFEKSGSIARGVSFGNRQSVAPVSALNFQMDGKLGPDLRLRAAITDQQMPYQPDGNTQNVQGLDNVFIELSGSRFTLVGGDILVQGHSQTPGFLRYSRNIQGLTVSAGTKEGLIFLSGGVMKGRFASTVLQVSDGVQGPYRITSPQGDGFVTVLANSERVYLDGRLLQRGFNGDYVIDYNLGEIQFTSRTLITRYSRVRIEYEYTNLAFPRSLVRFGHNRTWKRGTLAVEYLRESDSPNRSFYTDQSALLTAGSANLAGTPLTVPKADSTGFRSGTIQYKKENRLLTDGSEVTVWKYSVHPDSAHFTVAFTFVGQGRGNYVESGVVAFGKIYTWIDPDASGPRGSYEPGLAVQPPSRKQMLTVAGLLNVGRFETIASEIAFSANDANLLLDQSTQGTAYRFSMNSAGRSLPVQGFRLNAGITTELTTASFASFDRYRDVEFDRDWSLAGAQASVPSDEGLFRAHVSAADSLGNQLGYSVAFRHRKDYRGIQQSGNLSVRRGDYSFTSDLFLLDAASTGETSTWRRWIASLLREGKVVNPGYTFRAEQNITSDESQDSIRSSAGYFAEHLAFVSVDPSERGSVRMSQAFRTDFMPLGGRMEPFTRSRTTHASTAWTSGSHRLDAAVNIRDIEYTAVAASDKSVSGRVDWRGSFARNAVRTDIAYSVGSGRELKKNYGFVPVPVGQGTHTWRDDNNDGVAELGEFFDAINPDERSYIRVLLPTSEYIPAYSSLISARLTADAPRSWRTAAGVRRVASLLSFAANLNRDARTSSGELRDRLTGGWNSAARDQLIGGKHQFRSTLYVNRVSPKYGAEVSYADQLTQRVTTLGWENTGQSGWSAAARISLTSRIVLKLSGGHGSRSSGSDYLQGRTYAYTFSSLRPELTWTPLTHLRLSVYMLAQQKGEKPEPSEHPASLAKQSDGGFEARWIQGESGSLQAEVRSSFIDFRGIEQSALGYDLLGGLRPGQNFVCTVNWNKRLVSGLQLQLSYDGRKSPGMNIVHLGRVTVSAVF